jgi:endonuclease G
VLRTGKNPVAIGFIYENVGSRQPMRQTVRSIDEIEQLTGIDFFSALDDDIERRIEAKSDLSEW